MKIRFLTLAAAAALILAGCGQKQQKNAVQTAERVEQVETTVVKRSTVTRSLEVSSTLQGWQTMNIAPSLTGKIEHIYTEVGTRVRKERRRDHRYQHRGPRYRRAYPHHCRQCGQRG